MIKKSGISSSFRCSKCKKHPARCTCGQGKWPERTKEEISAMIFVLGWTKKLGWIKAKMFIEAHDEDL